MRVFYIFTDSEEISIEELFFAFVVSYIIYSAQEILIVEVSADVCVGVGTNINLSTNTSIKAIVLAFSNFLILLSFIKKLYKVKVIL